MKRLILVSLLFFTGLVWAKAQMQVTGRVSDIDGKPLPFVSIGVKGTIVGVNSIDDGSYSINVTDDKSVLVFSFVGYATVEQQVGGRSVVNVTLLPEATELTAIVVTALGISKKKRALGYAVSELKGEEMSKSRGGVNNPVNAETVALQKYIDLFTNGSEAWTEIRRTGYPVQLTRPDDVSVAENGSQVKFVPLSETKGLIVARVKYPTLENTVNKTNWETAIGKLEGGTNNYYSPMFRDKRRTEGPHPANK